MSGVWMRSSAQIKGADKASRAGTSSLVQFSQLCNQQRVLDMNDVHEGVWTWVQLCVGPSAASWHSDDVITQKSQSSTLVSSALSQI